MVHDIKNKIKLHMVWCWPQSTIRYFHLTRLTKSSYQKAEKKIVKRKKKRIEREANSRYVKGVIDVEWERNGEREKKKKAFLLIYITYGP